MKHCRFCEVLNKKYNIYLPKGYKFDLPTESQWEYCVLTDKEFAESLLSVSDWCWDDAKQKCVIRWRDEYNNTFQKEGKRNKRYDWESDEELKVGFHIVVTPIE